MTCKWGRCLALRGILTTTVMLNEVKHLKMNRWDALPPHL
jgi:hypothetical protein